MSEQIPREPGLRVATVLGSIFTLVGVLLMILLVAGSLSSSTEVIAVEQQPGLLPEPQNQDRVAPETPTVEAPTVEATPSQPDPDEPVVAPTVEPTETEAPEVEPAETEAPTVEPAETEAPEVEPAETEEPVVAAGPLRLRSLDDSDLGTGSSEFSAVALNEDTNRLLIADDAGLLYEFDLDDDGLPITPPRRRIQVAVGAGDIEGLTWIADDVFVIAHEDDGVLTLVTIDDTVTTLTDEQLLRRIDTQVREENGNGLEGVAVDLADNGFEFVVVDERPPTIYGIDAAGSVVEFAQSDLQVSDLSDIYVSPQGVYSVISDESKVVIDFHIDAQGTVVVDERLSLQFDDGEFEQPEGVVRSKDGSRLYVVGEQPGPGKFSFGFWSTE